MKKALMTGFITLLPLTLTIMVIVFLFDLFTNPFLPLVHASLSALHIELPPAAAIFVTRLIGFFLLCLLILFLGFIARQFFLKGLIRAMHGLFSRIPLIKTVYEVSRDVFGALFAPEGKPAFKEPVFYPFPHAPYYSVGFNTGTAPKECERAVGKKLCSVFAPTAPHPISGFLFLIAEQDLYPASMTKEDALKFLVSCGVILPETEQQDHD